MKSLYIGVAGILGALARYGLSLAWNPASSAVFPWGTLLCNFAGCLLLGYLTFADWLNISVRLRLAVTSGFIGSFTTFSTFSFETVAMFKEGHVLLAAAYVGVSLWGGLGLAWIGMRFGELGRGRKSV